MKQPLWERVATHVVLLIACAIALFPVLWIVSTSFKNQFDVLSTEIELIPREPTLENYQNLFDPTTATGGFFWNWFGNSLLISVLTTVLSVFLASTAAYALSRYRFFGKRGATSFFLTSQMFPAVILLVPLFQLLAIQLGLLNTPWALVLAYATTAIPFCVLMLKSYFDTLPVELEEAARIDGLGPYGPLGRRHHPSRDLLLPRPALPDQRPLDGWHQGLSRALPFEPWSGSASCSRRTGSSSCRSTGRSSS
jgi:arabinogalactan oligomer/maltooligosaccharide transport system permease protein